MFPLLYDAHHRLHTEDLPFWLDLAQQQPGPILELGCGSGRVLIPLLQSGQSIVGLDHDAGMLAVLQANLPPALRQQAALIQADFTRFRLGGAFGLILMPCNTYSTLPPAARRALLGCVRRHLAPGGQFAASLPNPEWLRSLPRVSPAELEEIFPHPLDGEPVQVSSAWRRTRREFILDWYYDHLQPDGLVERLTVQLRHQLTAVADYVAELHAAGFEAVQTLGGYDRSPLTADAPDLILLAG